MSKQILNVLTLVLFFLLSTFFINSSVFAQQGCCSWHGGIDYCDSYSGRYVCNDGSYSPTCTCGGGYNYSIPTTPSCPLFSRYNSINEQCECYSGYVASGTSCISNDQYCKNEYGFNSRYNILDDTCECSYGNVFNEAGTRCISGDNFCSNQYGFNSEYDSLEEACTCRDGYVFNKQGTNCISQQQFCNDNFGINSTFNVLSKVCECDDGYYFDGIECILEPDQTEEVIEEDNIYGIYDDSINEDTQVEQDYKFNETDTLETNYKQESSSNELMNDNNSSTEVNTDNFISRILNWIDSLFRAESR